MTTLTAIRLHILSTYRNGQRPVTLAHGVKKPVFQFVKGATL